MADDVPRGKLGRLLRALVAIGLGTTLGLVVAEGLVRYLIFSDSPLALSWGGHLRVPRRFADPKTDEDYFKLRQIWMDVDKSLGAHRLHPVLGWHSALVTGDELGHLDAENLGDRRPVLMYGDSFVACMTPEEECWQGLVEDSALSRKVGLINYGVRGYGLGQIYLMLRDSLDQWQDRDPLVIVGVLLDDDLDRVVYEFRGGPKPRFGVSGEELTIDYPGDVSIEEWMKEHPPSITSYLGAMLIHSSGLLPGSWTGLGIESSEGIKLKTDTSRLLLREIRGELEARELDYFFIIFEGPRIGVNRKRQTWRREFLALTLDELEIPWVLANRALQKERRQSGEESLGVFYIPDGRKGGRHFNARGNQVVFKSLMRGMQGRFDGAIETLERSPIPSSKGKKK